jgi:hypothetical protein
MSSISRCDNVLLLVTGVLLSFYDYRYRLPAAKPNAFWQPLASLLTMQLATVQRSGKARIIHA